MATNDPLSGPETRSTALVLLAVIATIYLLEWAQAVFIPLVLALLVSYALGPVVDRLQKLRIPRALSAAVLLIAAVIVMMGRVPLGEYLIPLSGDVSQWILNVLNASVRRAILIGVSLGAIALSLKIIFGVERSYLGGGKE